MNKYYVQSGLLKEIVLASTPIQACIIAFQRLTGATICTGNFVVSQRGFDYEEHEEDENVFYTLETILTLMILASESDL